MSCPGSDSPTKSRPATRRSSRLQNQVPTVSSTSSCDAGPSRRVTEMDPSEIETRPIREDAYKNWKDPNSSPYLNWDPVQLEQSGYPFNQRKWICLICLRTKQQRFSRRQLMEEHILRDHAILQDHWEKGRYPGARKCSKCGNYSHHMNVHSDFLEFT